MSEISSNEWLYFYLVAYVKAFDTDKDAAKELEVSPAFLSGMLKGNKKISEKVANKLGFKKVWIKHESSPKTARFEIPLSSAKERYREATGKTAQEYALEERMRRQELLTSRMLNGRK